MRRDTPLTFEKYLLSTNAFLIITFKKKLSFSLLTKRLEKCTIFASTVNIWFTGTHFTYDIFNLNGGAL